MELAKIDYAEIIDGFNIRMLAEQFINYVDIKPNSKTTYRGHMKPFLNWLPSDDIRNITRQHIIDYRDALVLAEKSTHTVSSYLTIVRSFFLWLECNRIYPNIARNIKGIKQQNGFRKACLTPSQIRQALETFDLKSRTGLRDFAIFNLLVRTGLRTIEITRAQVGDIVQEGEEAILNIQGKGRDSKDDFVVLVDATLYPLRKYLDSRGPLTEKAPLFISTSNGTGGQPLKERTIRYIIKNTLRRINIDDRRYSAHSLRHTAVSLSIRNGASLVQAQAMARHSNPKTTMIYFHNLDRIKCGAEHFVTF